MHHLGSPRTARARRRSLLALFALLVAGLSSGVGPAARAASGVAGAYSFDTGSGTTLADSSGNDLSGTLTNGPVWTAGKNGSALQFDGLDDYVDLQNPPALQMTGSMTISAWVFETGNPADDGQIAAKENGSWQFKSSPDTGVRTFAIGVTGTSGLVQRYSRTVRALNTWYHVTGVYDAAGRTLDVYVNGVLDDGTITGAVPAAQRNTSSSVSIGRRSSGFRLKGRVDDLRIYGRALTLAEIQDDMNTPVGSAPSPSPSPSPIPSPSPSPIVEDTTPPSVPANLQSSNVTAGSVTVSWTAATDNVAVAGYRVFRNGVLANSTAQLSYADSGLQPSTTYDYAVVAFDAAGNESAPSVPLDVTTAPPSAGPVYPLRVSANRRYLVDQNAVPFLIAGDSPQTMIQEISTADAELFLANREGYGFNAMWVNLVGGFVNGSTYDGIRPFTVEGDLSKPSEAYFARADAMIRLAAQHGQLVILDPIETTAWLPVLRSNGVSKCRTFGRYLGDRYQAFDNIVWMSGNDFQTWTDPNDDAVVQAVALGIKDNDTRHLHTVELHVPASGSLDDPSWAPIIDFNASYSYPPTYAQVIKDYNRPNFIPTFLIEANYEFEDNTQAEPGTAQVLRIQEYRAQLSGATGQVYGSRYTWQFESPWKTFLDSPGSVQFEHMTNVFASRRWYDLVPDQAHTFVTAGYGTFTANGTNLQSNYVTAALTPDGTLGMAYMPSLRALSVNMAKLSGPVTARWYDPASGSYVGIAGSPLANTGTRSFSAPGTNADGDGDWLLVLEVSGPPDTTAPSVPANLHATVASSSHIDLTWAASADNVGVAGYRVYRDGAQIAVSTMPGFADAGLTPQTSYTYTVAAFDAAGNVSPPSAPVQATTGVPDTTAPSTPTNLQSSNVSASGATIAWTTSTDDTAVAGYRVFRNDVLVNSVTQASYVDGGLAPSTTYVYTVSAFDAAENVSARSAPLSVTTLAAPSTLLAAYGFSEGTGSSTADGSGNGITGLLGGATWATGHSGGGLSFNGSSAYVDLGNPTSLRLTGSLTVSAWVNENANVADDGIIVARSSSSGGWELKSSPDTGARTFAVAVFNPSSGYVARYSTTVRALNTWYHVAGVFNASTHTLDLYVNGTLSNGTLIGTVPSSVSDSGVNANIGRRTGGFHIRGVLDDVRIHGRALTASEIQSEMGLPQ